MRNQAWNQKHEIEVRRKDGTKVEVVKRVIRAEQIGNFSPLFCQYNKNRRVLVKSEEGDLSDPFRREASYFKKLYIEIGL